MNNKIITKLFNLNIIIIIIGLYQLIVGLFTLIFVIANPLQYLRNTFGYFFIPILLVFSTLSGLLLLIKKTTMNGINLSFYNQLLQLIQIKILGNSYTYILGFYLSIGFTDTPFYRLILTYSLFKFKFKIGLFNNDNEISASINIFALILILLINYINNKKLEEKSSRRSA